MWYTIDIITLPSPSEVYYEVYIYIYLQTWDDVPNGIASPIQRWPRIESIMQLALCVFFPPCLVALPVLTILPVDALDLYLYMYIYIYIHRVYIYIVFILCQPRTVVGQHPIPSDQHSTFGAQTISISKVFDTHHIEN